MLNKMLTKFNKGVSMKKKTFVKKMKNQVEKVEMVNKVSQKKFWNDWKEMF